MEKLCNTISIQYFIRGSSVMEEKEMKDTSIEKDEVTLSLFTDDII